MDSRAVYHSTKQVEIYFLLLKSSGLRFELFCEKWNWHPFSVLGIYFPKGKIWIFEPYIIPYGVLKLFHF